MRKMKNANSELLIWGGYGPPIGVLILIICFTIDCSMRTRYGIVITRVEN